MEPIRAESENLEQIFTDTYIIPDYQRKYTWTTDHCERLWEDLLDFHSSLWDRNNNSEYFLGSITVWRKEDNEPWQVIDGQQRLITLSLLIKALTTVTERLEENPKLLKCLFQEDAATGTASPDNKIRIESRVIEQNNQDIENIIRSTDEELKTNNKGNMWKNYAYLRDKVLNWAGPLNRKTDKEIDDMIIMLTRDLKILRIKSKREDDALMIFETINDRGTPLTDSDIIKVKLHPNASEEENKEFTERWNELGDPQDLLHIYMQILRTKAGDYGNTNETPRKFFYKYDKNHKLFENWKQAIDDLEKIKCIAESKWDISDEVVVWWKLLNVSYPSRAGKSSYWRFPLFAFLHNNVAEWDRDTGLKVDKDVQKEFGKLLIATVKFLVIMGINYKNTGKIRSPGYTMCAAIASAHKKEVYNSGNYLQLYSDILIEGNEVERFKQRLTEHEEYNTYVNLLVYLGSLLSPEQTSSSFNNLIEGKIDMEHILPRNWQMYEKMHKSAGWDEETHYTDKGKLGNLMLLEPRLNKRASNRAFNHKKEVYAESQFQDAIELSKYTTDWTHELLEQRNQKIHDRILNFIQSK